MLNSSARSKGHLVALLGLAVFCLGWDLWAVLRDQRVSSSDSFTSDALWLWEWFGGINEAGWEGWVNPKGSVATTAGLVLLWLVGQVPQATRLVSVLAHVALIFQADDLGRRLGRSPGAGLYAALFCGTCPMVFGWCRLDFREPALAVMVMAGIQVMVRVRPDRWLPMIGLGLLLALGVMTKPTYVVFMCVPGVWFLALRVRNPGHAARVLAMVAVMAAVMAPWLSHVGRELFLVYPKMATSAPGSEVVEKLYYYMGLPGVLPLLLLALASTVWLALSREVDRRERDEIALLAGTVLLSLLMFLLVFDRWSRYIVPLLPPAAVLAEAGVHRLQRLLPRKVGLGLAGLSAAALLAAMAALTVGALESTGEDREHHSGLLQPDLQSRDGYVRAMTALAPDGGDVLVAHDSVTAFSATSHYGEIGRFRGVKANTVELADARRMLAEGQAVKVLLVRGHPKVPLTAAALEKLWPERQEWETEAGLPRLADPVLWLAARPHRCTAWATDPDGLKYGACVVRARGGKR